MNPSAILSHPEFPELQQLIIEHTGLGYYADKQEDLASRIGRRMSALRIRDPGAYLAMLRNGARARQERDALIGELTVGETYFFRQPEHFAALRETIVPGLVEQNATSRRLRVWSAGCATGAEPYSLAILFRRDLARVLSGWDVSILATDINREFLARARTGRFDSWAFRELPENLKAECFERDGKQWVIRPQYRELVTFEYQNLVREPAPGEPGAAGRFDLILCRNVMIYFGREMVRATVARLYERLSEGGWLLVGHAEPNSDVFRAFDALFLSGATCYRKRAAGRVEGGWTEGPVRHVPIDTGAAAERMPRPPAARSMKSPRLERPPEIEPASVEEVRALADRGQWELAVSQCRGLLASHRLDAAAQFTHGLILEHTRGPEEAGEAFRRAIYLDRSFVLAHYHMGLCYQKRKSVRQARRAFENVLELLAGRPDAEILQHGDGISAAELRELASMHLELVDSV